MICFECAEKVEVTTDKNIVNTLLGEGWAIVDVLPTYKKEYLFLLARYDERRIDYVLKGQANVALRGD